MDGGLIFDEGGETFVRVWLVNTCRTSGFVLANVVAVADDDGALLKEDYPVYLTKNSRRFVDVAFPESIDHVVYWYATKLGGF